jgi:hypothetical protein
MSHYFQHFKTKRLLKLEHRHESQLHILSSRLPASSLLHTTPSRLLPPLSLLPMTVRGEELKEAAMNNLNAISLCRCCRLTHPMASSPPPLSDNPYDNYIKEKPAPPAPVVPTRERCANVHETLMACLMKSKVRPAFPAQNNESIPNNLRGSHAARSALKLGGRSEPASMPTTSSPSALICDTCCTRYLLLPIMARTNQNHSNF